jgi:hypothetical protein
MASESAQADAAEYLGTKYCLYRRGFDDKGIQLVSEKSPATLRFGPSNRWAHWVSQSEASFFESQATNLPMLEIKRTRLLPLPQYVIHCDGVQAVVLTCKSVFRQKWHIAFANGTTWWFHKPLFSAFFHARCSDLTVVRIRMIAEGRQCYALFSPQQDGPESISAIACIMHHRWRWDGF